MMAASAKTAIRLVVAPEGNSLGRFTARLESTGELLVTSTRQPLVDGARVLLAQGYDAGALLTMRHEGKAYDSFQPAPIGQWAGRTYEERDRDGLRCVRWIPRAIHAGGQKSGSEPLVAPEGRETENRFHGGGHPQPTPPLDQVASP